jgi:hypothetical protein
VESSLTGQVWQAKVSI